jgi:glutamate-1-semialdehyde 2,1-aminomutase
MNARADRSLPTEASANLYERAKGSLAGGVSTAFRLYERPFPMFFAEASGAELTDVDGNRYVDYVCGFGPIILGHGDSRVADAVSASIGRLQQIGGQHEAEVVLAERLCAAVPAFDCVRLALSGSEAVHGALRVARAATGRSLVVKFGGHYHGWLDTILTGTSTATLGLPESLGQQPSALADVVVARFNDAAGLTQLFEKAGDRIAALIMEPLPCNGGVIPPADGFLELARELTAASGSVLVFDEVITGFRLGLGGAQERLGVVPDLAVVAKAMANGVPISAFGGRRELMDLTADNRVLHAGTYNGGGVSVAAALATMEALEDGEIHQRITRLGGELRDGLAERAAEHGLRMVTQGPGPVFFAWFLDEGEVTTFDDHLRADFEAYARFAEEMLAEGVRVIPAGRWYVNGAHTDEQIEETLAAASRVFARIGN